MNNSQTGNNGDQKAIDLVQEQFIKHTDLIRGFIRSLLADQACADDVLQEAFITITRKASSFQPGTSFPKWACAIARYKVMEARRAMMKRSAVLLSEEVIEALAITENATITNPKLVLLEKCRRELPPTMKRAVDLRYEGDHPAPEIASHMGWKVEAVYVALSRARNILRECLAKKEMETQIS